MTSVFATASHPLASLQQPSSTRLNLPLESTIHWNWDWPLWATVAAGVAAVALVLFLYAREQQFVARRTRVALALLRITALAVAAAMLAQPAIERRRVAPPRLVLLVDRSASMLTEDVPAEDVPVGGGVSTATTRLTISRLEALDCVLAAGSRPLAERIGESFALAIVPFDEQADAALPASSTSNDFEKLRDALKPQSTAEESMASGAPADVKPPGTHVGDAVEFALRQLGGPPAAIVLLTDGISTGGTPLAEAAARSRTIGVPIFAIAIGSDRPQLDAAIDDVLAEQVVFPGDRLQVTAAVRAVGLAGQTTRLAMTDGTTGDLLAESTVNLGDDAVQTIRLALRPTEPGPFRIKLALDPLTGEADIANNRAELTIDVRSKPIRTLLVDSTPSYEFRALKSLLERDPAIDLKVLLQDADVDFPKIEARAIRDFPANLTELLEYDVLLLLDVDPALVPRQAWPAIEEFVATQAGGLGIVAGPRFMPQAYQDVAAVQALLPIRAPGEVGSSLAGAAGVASFTVMPTAVGLDDAALQLGESPQETKTIWAALPPVMWMLPSLQAKPGANVLAIASSENASGQQAPIILRQYVGAGEVLFHAADETWRWRWRNDDRYFARYWGQAVRRLARGRAIRGVGSLSTGRAKYRVGEPVTLQARLGATNRLDTETAVVQLEAAHAATMQIELERLASPVDTFAATLRDLPADAYTARLISSGDGGVLTAEFTVEAPPGELERLTVNSRGLADAAQATGGRYYTVQTASRLPDELPAATPTAVERLPDEPWWNSSWLMLALCSSLGVEWLVRRRVGMI